jgi:poly(3-hydroxyalkanoate) synthetase
VRLSPWWIWDSDPISGKNIDNILKNIYKNNLDKKLGSIQKNKLDRSRKINWIDPEK